MKAFADLHARGASVRLVCDCEEHLDALGAAGVASGAQLPAVLELCTAYRPFGAHVGVRRSPARTPEDAVRLARYACSREGVTVAGVMMYEAHVAGLPDDRFWIRAMKRRAGSALRAFRGEVTQALKDEEGALDLVNGAGTGSLASAVREEGLTEVTAGSAFFLPHLFDAYRGLPYEPAAFFALPVARRPAPGFVTVSGGGFAASGAADGSRLPRPYLPRGLTLTSAEGAGEVQTPLRVGAGAPALAPGAPVIFRHAKAGELCAHFPELLLIEGGAVVDRVKTYRGLGATLL
jgi:D-serine deaminase-like pyridoxal phosphate-dependent protein